MVSRPGTSASDYGMAVLKTESIPNVGIDVSRYILKISIDTSHHPVSSRYSYCFKSLSSQTNFMKLEFDNSKPVEPERVRKI
jgi:hypothetical protein